MFELLTNVLAVILLLFVVIFAALITVWTAAKVVKDTIELVEQIKGDRNNVS